MASRVVVVFSGANLFVSFFLEMPGKKMHGHPRSSLKHHPELPSFKIIPLGSR
jgi:hypothetical protein